MGSVSDEGGNFTLEKVPLGEHEVTVSHMGYKPYSVKVWVENNFPLQLEISLVPASQELDEVIITSEQGKKLLEQSSRAITVLETKELKLQSADLGQLLAQTQGVSVRRSGGLGSGASVSLNGLTGKQIRYFVDGIPLGYLGYTFGLSTIPVSLIDRIEIYKGVVPVNLAGDDCRGSKPYQ